MHAFMPNLTFMRKFLAYGRTKIRGTDKDLPDIEWKLPDIIMVLLIDEYKV
jgi:hypothetical protein